MKILNNNKGFTLSEIMVTTFIFLILMGGVYTALAAGERSFTVNRFQIEMQQEMRKAMEWMINDLRQAGATTILDVPADNAWYTQITFKLPTGVSGGNLTWSADDIVYNLGGANSDQLQKTVGAGAAQVIANNLESLQFRRLSTDADMLEVAMVARRTTTHGIDVNYALNFDIQLRN